MMHRIFGHMRRFLRPGLALCAGGLLAHGAAGQGWWTSILGLALLLGILRDQEFRSRLLVMVLATSMWFGIHVSWMRMLGTDAWLLLVILCVIPWLLLAVISLPQRGLRLYLLPTSAIVLIEWLHDNLPWGGFPWGNIAYSQLDGPFANLAQVGGQSLVTATSCLVAVAVLQVVENRRILSGFAICAVLLLASHFARQGSHSPVSESVNVAVVQGGPVGQKSDAGTEQWQVFNSHIAQTEALARDIESGRVASPEVIVWPENSTDVDPLNNVAAYQRLSALSKRIQVPILIGGVTWQNRPFGPRNAGILWQPGAGPSQMYAKTHLVPFGEYIPFRKFLSRHIRRFKQIPSDFIPGNQPGIFELRGRTFGDVICFEIAYESHLVDLVRKGATFLTLQTNNATYQGTDQSAQQLAIARFRAIEHRRSVAMASTTGSSTLINDSGEVVATVGQERSGYATGMLPSVSTVTFTDRHPHWVLTISLWIVILAGLKRIRKNRRVDQISHRLSS